MSFSFSKRKVLVTASTSGIGLAIAKCFSKEGASLVINGRDNSKLEQKKNELGCFGCSADATIESEIKYLVKEAADLMGGLDTLICNLGNGSSVPPGHEDPKEWKRVFDLNFFSATTLVSEAIPLLRESKGSIVCISSICGCEVVPSAPVTYSAAKAALNSFVAGIARPLGESGVRINAVAPGNILFNGSVWETKMQRDPDNVKDMLDRDVSLARLGSVNEIADAVLYLSSPSSSFITGTVLVVDGGQRRGR